jgi:hypothetical protein
LEEVALNCNTIYEALPGYLINWFIFKDTLLNIRMKISLLFVFAVLSCQVFAQQWTSYQFDENLTVSIPGEPQIIDTLGQHIVKVPLNNAVILIQKIPNEAKIENIETKEDILKSYDEFEKGFIGSQQGTWIDHEVQEKHGLLMQNFSYRASLVEEKHIRHCLVTFVNNTWYAAQFWEVEAAAGDMKTDREQFFASVKFSENLKFANQIQVTPEGSPTYKTGYIVGKLLASLMVIGFIAGAGILISRFIKKRQKAKV